MSKYTNTQNKIASQIHKSQNAKITAAFSTQQSIMIEDDLMLLLILKWKMQRKKKKKHSRYKKVFYNNLPFFEQRLRSRRIPRVALQDPVDSSWRTLLRSGNDRALITLTGLDFQTFNWLLERFRSLYEGNSPFIDPDGRIVPFRFPGMGGRDS